MKKLTKKAMAIVLSVMMLVVFMPTSTFAVDATSGDQQSDQQNQAEPTTPPVAEKNLKDNGDGTYDISLSVTGKSESSSESSKADVVVVMDVSGSMKEGTSSYVENKTGRYGLVDGKYVNLYSKYGSRYYKINNDGYTGTVYYENGNSHPEYTGLRYSVTTSTRLAVAKEAIGKLATELLSNNDDSNPEKVTVSLVSFSVTAVTEVNKTNNLTTFQNSLNSLSANGGTNWEDALQEASGIQARENAEKYVIFVSDGNPTYRNTRGEYDSFRNDFNDERYEQYSVWGAGNENDTTVARCYDHAKDDAKALVDAGWQFYGIGVFGNVDRMKSLVNYAYYGDNAGTAPDKYFSATDQAQLTAAFKNIINSITQNFGYSNVVINDGLTGLVSCDISGEASGFTYTKNGEAWADAPKATWDKDKKQIAWNLGDSQLENGIKYTVSFNVWPSQRAYDLVADLKNGVKTYNDLTVDEKAQIVPMSDGGYGLNTNTAAGVKYTQIETKTTTTEPEGYKPGKAAADGYVYVYNETTKLYTGTKATDGEAPIDNPAPIPVVSSAITVEKVWEGEAGTGEVQLKLMKDGKDTGKTVTLSKGDNGKWQAEVYVAPGLKAGEKVLESGHDYTLAEVNGGYKYEFSATSCHPMLINSATEVKNSDGSACVLLGTNTKKSNLEITKTVTRNDNVTDNTLFTYKVTIDEKNSDDVWFSIGDGQNVIKAENRVTGATAEEKDSEKTGYYSADSNSEITIKIKAGENIFFTNLAKGSEYSVEEVNIPSEYQLQKVVNQGTEQTAAKAEGTISANKTTYTVAYTNKLLTPTEVTMKVTKKVQGKNADRAFTFSMELKEGDSTGVVMPTDMTAATAANIQKGQSETVSFNTIKFTKPGDYTFKVKETNGTVPDGWSYDKTEKTITVLVRNNNGDLKATVTGNNPEIVNSYSASAATISIPVTKELTGTGLDTFDISNAFTFTLEGKNGAPMPETTTITNPDSDGGTATFGPITYTSEGTYEYTVTETGSVAHITNDSNATKTITVNVVDNDQGQLVASIKEGNGVTFTNTYAPEPTNANISVEKKLEGTGAPDISGKYTFKLEAVDNAPMPANNTELTNPRADGGTVTFGDITYTKAGTYKYTVTESGTVPGITNDSNATKEVTVVVTDNNGQLSAVVNSGETLTFTNTYAPTPTTANISVTKALDGTGAPDIKGKFTFTLVGASANTPMPADKSLTNPDSDGGTVRFGDITFTKAGIYHYTVTESGIVDGIENDPVPRKSVTVKVEDNGSGQLVASITEGDNLTFTNKVIKPIKVALRAKKTVEGSDAKEAFTFSIRQTNTNAEGADGAVMPNKTTATTSASIAKGQSETVTFNEITFTKPGTYTFNVKETNETEPPGWTYDNKVERTITVVVSKTNGALSTTVQNDNPTFTNKYSASPVNNFSIPVTKQLEGTGAPDITGKYTFTLEGENGAPMPADTQKTNPADGRIEFGPITYNSAGEYEYTVSETGTVAHITNDSNATKNITVVVEDNGKGQLVASFKEGDGVTFTNRYAPEPTTAKISVEKILKGTGAPDITGEYTFTLEGENGVPMPAVTQKTNPSSSGGNIEFGYITYTEAGIYKYTVTESGDVPGITNDSNTTKEVVVVVTDNNGQLEAVVNSGKELTFTNTYAPTATSATLEAEKVLKNMALQENQFTFQLLDSEDNLIDTKQNAADGKVTFDELRYTVPGVYNYKIKEVIPEGANKVKGVTYDEHVVDVTVTVEDDTNGVLGATVKYTGDTTFTNTYNASGKSGIVGLKTLEGKALDARQFTFKIKGKDGAPMPEKAEAINDAFGYVNFGEIDFELADLGIAEEDKSDENVSDGATEGESTEQGGTPEEGGSSEPAEAVATSTDEGANDEPSDENKNEDAAVPRTKTFTYTVTEVAGNEPGITYNTTPQEFTITVTDDGQGGLTVTTNPPTDKPNAPLFTINNTYTPAKANIGVTKNFVDGRTGLSAWDEYEDAKFEFELKAVGNAPLNPVDSEAAAKTVKVTKDSTSASFGLYEFDSPGKYEYTITEKKSGGIEDVVYDTTSHKVTVEVKEDSTTHQLSAEVKYDNNEESVVVTNTLKPAENAKLNVVKHVVNTNGQPLSVDGVFHVALFSDKNLTHRVSAVNELVFDGSKPTAEAEFKVTAGKKYYVAETDADGKPLSGAQLFGEGEDAASYSICFGDPADYDNVIDYPQSAAAEIPESGSADDVEFSNIFDGKKFMVLGSISINKEVKIGEEPKNVDGSFYVTAEYSQENSDELEKRTVELKVKNGKTEQPATISNLPTNTDITLKETDANGNILENSVYNPIFTYGDESGKTLKVKLTEDDSDINVKLENSEKLIDVAFDLTWDDYGNRDNTRDEYEVTLFANGVEVEDSTKVFSPDVTEGDDCKWTDLRQYDDEENEIVYSVKQTKVPDQYSSNTDGTDVGLSPDEDGIVHLIDTYRAVKITKKVTDSTGKAIKYNGDFYVTMFADPDCKEIVKDPVKITLDNEKSKTVIIPVPANSLYYLAETDADGNKVDSSFEFIPTFSSTVAEASDDETSIVLTNQAKAGTSADDPDNDTDAKTGDSANLMLMLLALLTSMLIGAVVLIRGRRREN